MGIHLPREGSLVWQSISLPSLHLWHPALQWVHLAAKHIFDLPTLFSMASSLHSTADSASLQALFWVIYTDVSWCFDICMCCEIIAIIKLINICITPAISLDPRKNVPEIPWKRSIVDLTYYHPTSFPLPWKSTSLHELATPTGRQGLFELSTIFLVHRIKITALQRYVGWSPCWGLLEEADTRDPLVPEVASTFGFISEQPFSPR